MGRSEEKRVGERRQMKISKSFSFACCFGTLDLGVDCGLYTCTGVGFSIIICVYLLFRIYFILNMYVLFLCILRGNKRNGEMCFWLVFLRRCVQLVTIYFHFWTDFKYGPSWKIHMLFLPTDLRHNTNSKTKRVLLRLLFAFFLGPGPLLIPSI